jgi:hypothetical protein
VIAPEAIAMELIHFFEAARQDLAPSDSLTGLPVTRSAHEPSDVQALRVRAVSMASDR